MFFLFCNFWRCLFFLLVDSDDYRVLCNTGYRKCASYLISFFVLLLKILSLSRILRFPFLLYAIIGLSCNAFFNLGLLICSKCQCLSMLFLMFGRGLLKLSCNISIVTTTYNMSCSLLSLIQITREELADIVLDYQHKFNNSLGSINA